MGKTTGTFVNIVFAQEVDADGNLVLIADSSLELTAANGDTLSLHGTIRQTVLDPSIIAGPFAAQLDVIDGTGRFEGAGGSVDFAGFFNGVVDRTFTINGEGTISTVGSSVA